MKIGKSLGWLLPVLVVTLFSIMGVFGFFHSVDLFVYDILLHLTKSPKESKDILLVDIDDATIDPKTGISTYPIPREYYGDVLLTLKEFGAQSAVFDIEFVGDSQLEFSPEDMQNKLVGPVFQYLEMAASNSREYLVNLFEAYKKGKISRSEFSQALSEVVDVNDQLFQKIQQLLVDFSYNRDLLLGEGAAIFGNAYFGSNLREIEGHYKLKGSKKKSKNSNEQYRVVAEQILHLIDQFPELLTSQMVDLLNREDIYSLLAHIEGELSSADGSTDFQALVQKGIDDLGLELQPIVVEVLSNPAALALFIDVRSYAEQISLSQVQDKKKYIQSYPFIELATNAVVSKSKGVGFTNVKVDEDGSRRRISLLLRTGNFYYPQLGFAGLLTYLGNPQIEVKRKSILLKEAKLPNFDQPKDIKIPLDPNGYMLINWPHKSYQGQRDNEGNAVKGREGEDSFQHLSFLTLFNSTALELPLQQFLQEALSDSAYDWFEQKEALFSLFDEVATVRQQLMQGAKEEGLLPKYKELKLQLDQALQELTNPQLLSILNDEIISGEYNKIEVEEMKAMQAEIQLAADEMKSWVGDYQKTRTILNEILPGKIAIIGFTASSSTDFGVNPFQERYPNPGTHASTINTILQQDFLKEIPLFYSILFAVILAFALYFILKPLSPSIQIISGIFSLVLIFVVGWAFLFFGGYYLPIFIPLMVILFTFMGTTAVRFISTSKEKAFVKKAFSHYISPDVIHEIMKDPEKLKLGGDSRCMTAIFTDVKGFSTISEKLTPVELVHLLNEYLSGMSDVILDLRGLIDKYEGDAIIAFFGAPNDLPEHAYLTCLSAVRMRRVEQELNKKFLEQEMTPTPLLTRYGINTGEMVVGNMGTATKMNYTMMGSAVNLAARLEGVNKQYGTWILISGDTYEAGGNRFFCRKVDIVRVVGINQPVVLYEIIEEEDRVSDEVKRGIEFFHEGFEYYQNRKWSAALKCFHKTLDLIPSDGPSLKYIQRCSDFLKKSPPIDWDGVTNLTSK